MDVGLHHHMVIGHHAVIGPFTLKSLLVCSFATNAEFWSIFTVMVYHELNVWYIGYPA